MYFQKWELSSGSPGMFKGTRGSIELTTNLANILHKKSIAFFFSVQRSPLALNSSTSAAAEGHGFEAKTATCNLMAVCTADEAWKA